MSNEGRFTVGTIEDFGDSKNGRVYSVLYFYGGKKFNISFSDIGLKLTKGQLVFMKISSSNPKIFDILKYKNIQVPNCIKISNIPDNGWAKLPLDSCK